MKHFFKRIIILALFADIVAAPVACGDAPPDWRPLMKENQPALVTFVGKDRMHSVGFFVSKDGHVLSSLQIFLRDQRPAPLGRGHSARRLLSLMN